MSVLGACGVMAGALAFGGLTVVVWRAAEAAAAFYNRKRFQLEAVRVAWADNDSTGWGDDFTDEWLVDFEDMEDWDLWV